MTRWLMGLLFVAMTACSGAHVGGDGGAPDGGEPPGDGGVDAGPPAARCPETPPADGDACTAAMSCAYMACDTVGAARASCDGTSWTVLTEPCGDIDCRTTTCGPGEICVHRIGGAFLSLCQPAPSGPVSCESICGAPCISFDVSPDPPEVFVCNACHEPPCA